MPEPEQELSLAEQAEQLEERFVVAELDLLEKLKAQVQKKANNNIKEIIGTLGLLENSLDTAHKNVLSHITVLSRALPEQAKALKKIEGQIEAKVDEVFAVVTARGGSLFTLGLSEKIDYQALEDAISQAEQNISGWIQLIGRLQEEFKVSRIKYRQVLAAPQEKLIDLLKGQGNYKEYLQQERREVWNRWVRVTTQRVLKESNLQKVKLQGFDLQNFIFKRKTNLIQADLRGANLLRADLLGANLEGANFMDVKYLTQSQLKMARNVDQALNVPKI